MTIGTNNIYNEYKISGGQSSHQCESDDLTTGNYPDISNLSCQEFVEDVLPHLNYSLRKALAAKFAQVTIQLGKETLGLTNTKPLYSQFGVFISYEYVEETIDDQLRSNIQYLKSYEREFFDRVVKRFIP
jgi:hypothetical protein